MKNAIPDRPARRLAPVIFQAALSLAVLIGTVAYPRAGGGGLVVPLGGWTGESAMDWLYRQGAPVISTSRDNHFMMVRIPTDGLGIAALSRGLLLISVPAPLCADTSAQDT